MNNSILYPRQVGFRPVRSTLDQILFLSQSILDGFDKPRPSFRTILSTVNCRLSTLLVELNLSFLIEAFAWFVTFTKVDLLEFVEVFRKDPFLDLYFSLFSSMIFLLLCLLLSAALFMLTIWPIGPPPPRSLLSSLLLLSDSRSVLTILSSLPSFLFSQCLWQIWQELSSLFSCSIRLQWVPGHSFLLGNGAGNAIARRGVLFVSSVIPFSLSPLISRIHSCLIPGWRHTVSSKFFDTQASSICAEKLVLSREFAVFSLVSL